MPSQVSAGSQVPALPRQTTRIPATESIGHAALEPVQVSATSQGPAEARHRVLPDWNVLAGHVVADPSHVSATSHTPALARHTVAALIGRQRPFAAPVRVFEQA